ncbi:hypothetical protein PTKIN_Ptkin15bG0186200 [Pterospermum kingtungense]
MSDRRQTAPFSDPIIVDDLYKRLEITLNPDGSLTRNANRYPNTSPSPDPNQPIPVLSKDITINQSNKTWARIFLPRQALDTSSGAKKLPLIAYYHPGGFINCSAASTTFHVFCSKMALELQAIIVSVDYRLAPENRLPAAYDDAVEALHWIKATQEEWLKQYADFANFFLMGSSSGGNIVYHAGLRAADDPEPLKIRGLILHQPFFGGSQKVESELRLVNDPILPPGVSDLLWGLALPIGADLDHEYSNPTADKGLKLLDKVVSVGWRVLVTGCDGDPLIDRQIGLTKLMEEKGVKVVSNFPAGGHHGVDFMQPDKAEALILVIKEFIRSSSLATFGD